MHAWLFVLAVLAILQGVTQVASTDGQFTTPAFSSSSISALFTTTSRSSSSGSSRSSDDSGSSISASSNPDGQQPTAEEAISDSGMAQSEPKVDENRLEKLHPEGAEETENSVHRPVAGELHLQVQTDISDSDSLDLSSSDSSSSSSSDSSSRHSHSKPDPAMLVQIEKNLGSLFGFSKRPKIDRSKVVIPEAMKQLYAQIMGHDLVDSVHVPKKGLSTRNANTVRSFTHEESHIDERFKHHHRFRLMFNVSNIPLGEKLRAAELTLNRDAIEDQRYRVVQHQVLVYDIVRPGVKGKRAPTYLLIDSKTVKINETGPINVDVLPAVERWLRHPKRNHGLFIQVISKSKRKPSATPKHEHVRLRRSTDESHDKWAQKQPLLFTYTDDGRHKQRPIRDALSNANRARRTPMRNRRRKNGTETCQRRPLYVDFSDVGWSDWIVAPPGYEAYYCHGECQFPIADHLNTTNHAIVQTLVNSISPSLAPKACCVPTQLSSISMLYLNEQNKVVLKNYQDMTVVGCGCR